MILSTWSTDALEDVSTASGDGLRWFQIQVLTDLEVTKQLVTRAETAGYKALVVTVDQPTMGIQNAERRNSFDLPSHLSLGNFPILKSNSTAKKFVQSLLNPSTTWKSIDWLRSITMLPIVLKGILRPEDAREALKHNIQGILVSNHGGRYSDSIPATVSCPPDLFIFSLPINSYYWFI